MLTAHVSQAMFPSAKAPISIVAIGKQNWWIAREVGKALGYNNASRFSKLILGKWSDRLQEGKHYKFLKGDLLASFKELVKTSQNRSLGHNLLPSQSQRIDRLSIVHPRTRHLLLLTEPGLYASVSLSKSKTGIALMDFLTCEVLPMIRKTGTYVPENHPMRKIITSASVAGMFDDPDQIEDHAQAIKLLMAQSKFSKAMAEAHRAVASRLEQMEAC